MRNFRTATLGATMLALLLGACTSGGSGSSASTAASEPPASTAPSTEASAGPSIASTLVLGGPPECPERPFCLVGLEKTYGLEFKEFTPLDAGGPLTVQALSGGQIQVGLLFTSDPAIAVNGFVLLQDDKQLQLADNLIPVVRKEVDDANPLVAATLNAVMDKLRQAELTELNKAVTVDLTPTAEAAKAWLTKVAIPAPGGGSGKIVVGSTNFYEQEILGEIFAQALEANGLTVERKFQLGNREIVFPALESGEIDILAEYAATALEFVNGGAGEASTHADTTAEALRAALVTKNLVALNYAQATDQNGFVVTKTTADQYGLTTISDLAKPAP